MEEVRFYFDRENAQFTLYTAIGVMVITGLPQAIISYRDPDLRVWVISILCCAALVYYFLFRKLWFFYTTKNPGLVLNAEGIWDHRDRGGHRFVPWSEVISCTNCGDGRVRIALGSSDSAPANGLYGKVKRVLVRKHQIYFQSSLYGVTPAEIVFKANTFLKASHAAHPPYSQASLP